MISQKKIEEIERSLATGRLSRRAIAMKLGVSRTIVTMVAEGRFDPCRPDRRRERIVEPPRHRCPTCGYRVPFPCVYCRAEAYRRRSSNPSRRAKKCEIDT